VWTSSFIRASGISLTLVVDSVHHEVQELVWSLGFVETLGISLTALAGIYLSRMGGVSIGLKLDQVTADFTDSKLEVCR
jgi:hypothetical protein